MLSVVITLFNGAATLAQQLEGLAAQVYNGSWEVVLVDNGCTDDSVSIAESYRGRLPELRIIPEPQRGRPFALNGGVRATRGEVVLMTDQDDEVAPGWLAGMAAALTEYDLVGCRVDHKKLNPPPLHWTHQEMRLPRLWFPPHLPYAAGTSLGFRRPVFDAVGGFDKRLRYVQDVEFCIQAQRKGYRLGFAAKAVLHYRRRTSLKEHYDQARSYARESAVLARRYWPQATSTRPLYAAFARNWLRLGRKAVHARTPTSRYALAWELGRQIGRTQGVLFEHGLPV